MSTHWVILALVASVIQFSPNVDSADIPFKQVCYTGLGCFNNSAPFDNTYGKVPASPDQVGVTQRLYTRATRANYETLSTTTSSRTFDPAKLTKIVIHGFQNTVSTKWVTDFKDALLNKGDFNVIVVGWGHGAGGLDYLQAAANVRLVATKVKLQLEALEKKGLDLADVHLIGHSLGAHTSGQVGRQLGGRIGRISGMDPAQPSFEHYSDDVRLDKSDALFVDVLHTDGNGTDITKGGYGLMQESGHVDFYVNGGQGQPGCEGHDGLGGILGGLFGNLGKKRGLFDNLDVSCSHGRSHDVFLESIVSNCQFMGFPCSSWDEFEKGHCLDCSKGGCSKAGYPADQGAIAGKKYFMTNSRAPLCGVHYRLYLDVHDSVHDRTDGTIYVALVGSAGETGFTMATNLNQHLTGSTVVNKVALFDKEVGDVSSIKVKYVKDTDNDAHTHDSTAIAAVHIVQGESGKSFTTCKGKFRLTNNQAKTIPAQVVGASTPTSCFNPAVFA